jgi:hypothetical protein
MVFRAMRIRLHPGVWTNAASLTLAGGGAVTAATATQAAVTAIGYVGILLGVALFVWGIRINGRPWWRYRPWRPKLSQLYLYAQPGDPEGEKSYLAVWSPKNYFAPVFSDYESRASSWPPADPVEKDITLHLFNAGPDDVRHVQVTWDMGEIDIPALVADAGLFDGCIEAISNDRLELVADSGFAARPLAISRPTTIPLLRAGETISVRSPRPFTNAFAVRSLCQAKSQNDAAVLPPAGAGFREVVKHVNGQFVKIETINIDVQYAASDGSTGRQHFELIAWLCYAGTVSPVPNAEGAYEPELGGITAWIDHVRIIS